MERSHHVAAIRRLLQTSPVVAILGARQVGKTTLAREVVRGMNAHVFDLENPLDLRALDEPMTTLGELSGVVVIDEIQRHPNLFPILRVLADRPRKPARFLVLGSAAPELLRQSAESLAGRIAFYDLPGFMLAEVGDAKLDRLWWRGQFPRAFLAKTDADALRWRRDFIRTFLAQDVAQLGVNAAPAMMERFWAMLAHHHGQLWNSSELARAFGLSHSTVQKYLDTLVGTFVMTRLQPYFVNIAKRLVRSPKIYVADSGVLHTLLDLQSARDLARHPKVGASFEGFVIAQLAAHLGARPEQCFFWATHSGAELDLLVVRGNRRHGFEIKRTDAPTVTKSMHSAMAALELRELTVIHSGLRTFQLADNIRAVAAARMREDIAPLS
jgi:predicted AAA+ superfamily ATPase